MAGTQALRAGSSLGSQNTLGKKVPKSVPTQQRLAAPRALLADKRFPVPEAYALQVSSAVREGAQAFGPQELSEEERWSPGMC